MAIYFLNAVKGSRSGGQSALAKLQYVTRTGRYAGGIGELVWTASGNLPSWAAGPAAFWTAADEHERANGRLFREYKVALPAELSPPAWERLVHSFALDVCGDDGLAWTAAIHRGGEHNPHFHFVVNERVDDGIERDAAGWFSQAARPGHDPAGGGARKIQRLEKKRFLYGLREAWAGLANAALAEAGHAERIDHRTLAAQRDDAEARGDHEAAAELDREPVHQSRSSMALDDADPDGRPGTVPRRRRRRRRPAGTDAGKRAGSARKRNGERRREREELERQAKAISARAAVLKQQARNVEAECGRATRRKAEREAAQRDLDASKDDFNKLDARLAEQQQLVVDANCGRAAAIETFMKRMHAALAEQLRQSSLRRAAVNERLEEQGRRVNQEQLGRLSGRLVEWRSSYGHAGQRRLDAAGGRLGGLEWLTCKGGRYVQPEEGSVLGFTGRRRGSHVEYSREAGGSPSFVDCGERIEIADWRDREAVRAALELSAGKWGDFVVTGCAEYKAVCAELAAEHGYRISNPELREAIEQDIATRRLKEVLARCGDADAGSPEMLAEWREACRAASDMGVDINMPDAAGITAAHVLALDARSAEWLRIGLEAGMDLAAADRFGITPLHEAVLNANPAVMAVVLEAGADPDIGDPSGQTPLHRAAHDGREEHVRLLLEAGANPALKDDQGRIPFDLANHPEGKPMAAGPALEGLYRPRLEELRQAQDMATRRLWKVLERRGDADAGSPEMLAEWREACRAASDMGADINAPDAAGITAAHFLALDARSPGWLRIGLEAGMDLAAADKDGVTPLHTATCNANPEMTDILLEAGVGPDIVEANGQTPLHWAAMEGREEHVQRLLDAGANPALKDNQGRIPFDLANRPNGPPMAAGPALECLYRPRLEADVVGLRDAGDYRGPPIPERLESLTVCQGRPDLRRLTLDETRDAALTLDAAERSSGLFGWLRNEARLTMLPERLGDNLQTQMKEWAAERDFEFGEPEVQIDWSPPGLPLPSDADAEIMAPRRVVKEPQPEERSRRERENALQQTADPEPDSETRRLQSMRPSNEQRQDAVPGTAERMEADGLFLPRRRDPALAGRWDHPPERSLLFVVASPAHVPDEESLLRRWHHVAVQDPSSGPEGLKALRELHPDAVMAPAPELRENWPKDVPALDPDKAEHEFRNWGLAGHIDMAEGRVPEPKPKRAPAPKPKRRDAGPSF